MMTSSRALQPSFVTLPPVASEGTIFDFFLSRFDHVPTEEWRRRFAEGEVLFDDGRCVGLRTSYLVGARIRYFRSVFREPELPFAEKVLFENDQFVLVDKPHFMPVSPGGSFVNHCVIYRQQERLGRDDLKLVHRLDRDTAGLLLIAKGRRAGAAYGALFRERRIKKEYLAIARVDRDPGRSFWWVENRIVQAEQRFRSRMTEGSVNARTKIFLIEHRGDRGLFRLRPVTGKKHQLRLHLASLGFPIWNDRYYPELLPEQPPDFDLPLQLVASGLEWRDPFSGQWMRFRSRCRLQKLVSDKLQT